ncbi:MurR/RpiR family transcriptional regulator [Halalkalibacter oceani]|uniref:MurR/RpiR family transcriptional regulator n=1 Tax=Halalkalibacter oceani TaxID=1653776 RepID=UPI003399886E
MANQEFNQLVKEHYDTLSAGKKKAAKYIAEHLEEASYSTMVELQQKIGVSETTIIRLAYSLGFGGFSAMQKFIRQELMSARSQAEVEGDHVIADEYLQVLEQDMAILSHMREHVDHHQLEAAAQKIINADRVFVTGQRTSYASAYWFSYTLGFMLANIRLMEEKTFEQELLNMTENSVLIAISFPRYHKDTYRLAELAREAGAQVIAITDSELSPICKLASLSLFAKTNRDQSGYNGIAPVISLLNMLVVAVRKNVADHVKERLSKVEDIYKRNQILFE